MTIQAAYAANLKNQALGLPIYRPFSPRERSRKIGDVAFYNGVGEYTCIQNAFNENVLLVFGALELTVGILGGSLAWTATPCGGDGCSNSGGTPFCVCCGRVCRDD
jgi:hypothetical protein